MTLPRISKTVLAVLLSFAILMAVLYIAMAMSISPTNSSKTCFKSLSDMILGIGISMFILSVMGLVGAFCQIKAFQNIFMLIISLSTFAVICSFFYILLGLPHRSVSSTYSRAEYGYWLNEYSSSLQTALVNEKDWLWIKSCLNDFQLCDRVDGRNASLKLHSSSLNDVLTYPQKGCCFPPKRCGLVSKNITHWDAPETGIASKDGECEVWTNIYDGQCYDCDSCKAGYLATIQLDWDISKPKYLLFIVFLITTTFMAYCAFQENEHKNGYIGHVQPAASESDI